MIQLAYDYSFDMDLIVDTDELDLTIPLTVQYNIEDQGEGYKDIGMLNLIPERISQLDLLQWVRGVSGIEQHILDQIEGHYRDIVGGSFSPT